MHTSEHDDELVRLRLQVAELTQAANQFGLNWTRTDDSAAKQALSHGVGLIGPVVIGEDSDAPRHVLIQGDNLEALTALNSNGAAGTVDLIYIDPPYNTGNSKRTGFTYTDRFRTAQDVERHSSWLTMMSDRLEAALPLLKSTGVILISIDDKEVHHLRVLCDTVFGEHNFISQMVWDGGTVKNNAKLLSTAHEYVLVYARSLAALRDCDVTWREPRPGADRLIARYNQAKKRHQENYTAISAELKTWVKTADLSKRLKVFTAVDSRGLFTYADLSAPGGTGARYELTHPGTGKPCQVPSRGWGYTEERMAELIADDRVLFGPDETAQPMRKLYLHEKMDQVRRTILEYPGRTSTHLLEHMLGKRNAFNNPKNLDMIADLIRLMAPKDAVVLDFFAGSGTTGHAVLKLNAADGGTRQFIIGTNNENNICDDVTVPRLTAAITGSWGDGTVHTPLGGQLVKLDTAPLRDGQGRVNIDALAGLVELGSGGGVQVYANTVHSTGTGTAIFAWTGSGRVADAKRSWKRFLASATKAPSLLIPKGADPDGLGDEWVDVIFY
jgi:adenine-specific DNA-methyltransferase